MIAEIFQPFETTSLSRKIDYQIKKIESGNARELYNSTGDNLFCMYRNMELVSSMNDRVKLPYIEFVLSSPVGENLSDDRFVDVAQEYLQRMGYGDSCYSIIKNEDKEHEHIHILATTIGLDGRKISDSHNWQRSAKIMRELEKEYGLQVTEKGKSIHSKSLGESQYRRYFFDTALRKALRSHNAKERVERVLEGIDFLNGIDPELRHKYTNDEWKILLGDDSYEKLLVILSEGKFFNSLYKDELLSAMERLFLECDNAADFRNRLEKEGYYMRLVSDKKKSYYVYGIPERGFYVKDSAFPEHFRFGKIPFSGKQMSADEQKHYLYNQVFITLNASSGYDDFKSRLATNKIKLIEHINATGVYGISFVMAGIDEPVIFKASDISKRLSYKNIQEHFQKEQEKFKETGRREQVMSIEPVLTCYASDPKSWEKDINYMYPVLSTAGVALESGTGRHRDDEDDFPNRKKKKRRNRGMSI